jgi:hydrocephalus-inducing protein
MSFDFYPRSFGIIESNYRFEIPAHALSMPFLLAGQVTEPQILFDRTFISFHPSLIGHHIEDMLTLINKENRSFNYHFLERSFINGISQTDLIIEPSPTGVIPANTSLPLQVIFRPSENRPYTYLLQCRIDQSVDLLNVHVKGEGFANLSTIRSEGIDGRRYELQTASSGKNEIRFDDVLVGNSASRQIEICNDGKYAFDYQWTNDDEQDLGPFTIEPMKGTVSNSQKQICQIVFKPRTREHRSMIQRLLHLNIVHGQKYDVMLIGQTTTPNIHLSFETYQFGPCFIYRAGMPENTCQLQLINQDLKDHIIECLYQSTAQLMVEFKAGLIHSKQTSTCKMTFYPREQKVYRETITFEVDGLTLFNVIVEGEGVDFRVELAEPKHKIVNLGKRENITKSMDRFVNQCLIICL